MLDLIESIWYIVAGFVGMMLLIMLATG